jgi:hypothetical protein
MSAGGAVDPITMEQARVAAHAHIELTYLTAASMALVERAYRLGFTQPADHHAHDVTRVLQSPNWQELLFPVSTMPPPGPERLSEAIGRALPALACSGIKVAPSHAGIERFARSRPEDRNEQCVLCRTNPILSGKSMQLRKQKPVVDRCLPKWLEEMQLVARL